MTRRIAAVVLVDARGWLLLQERDEHAPVDPERWSPVGGGIEVGESDADAAARELEEETGLRGIDLDPLGVVGFYCATAARRPTSGALHRPHRPPRRRRGVPRGPADRLRRPEHHRHPRLEPRPGRRAPSGHRPPGVRRAVRQPRTSRLRLRAARGRRRRDPAAGARRARPDRPRRWGLSGGHLEPGEEPEPGAYREVEEETGVRLEPGHARALRRRSGSSTRTTAPSTACTSSSPGST